MGQPFLRADHVRSRPQRQRRVRATKNQIAAHTRRQVQHRIHIGGTDAVRHLTIQGQVARRRAGFGITHMNMNRRGPGACGGNGAFSDLFGRTWHMGRPILCLTRSGHGTSDKDFACHGQRHDSP